MIRQPLRSILFPYTTLFRSWVIIQYADIVFCGCLFNNHPHSFDVDLTILFYAEHKLYDVSRGKRLSSRSEEHTSELQSRPHLVCRLLLEKKKIPELDCM